MSESQTQWTVDQVVDAVRRHEGSRTKAAAELNCPIRTLYKKLALAKKRGMDIPPVNYTADRDPAIAKAIEPLHRGAPDGYITKGVSSYHDGETGEVRGFWLKTDIDKQRQMELMKRAIEEMCASIPSQEVIVPPAVIAPKLCNSYVFTDYHMGMLAWWKEGGADWDLTIAERVLLGCFEQMLASAPPARVGILIQLGDFLHTDGLVPVTPAHGHVLDADSRFQKIVTVTIRALRRIVNRMLEKHEHVHVIMGEGNHDPTSSIWLQQMFHALFENEPRITICDSPLPYYAYQFGKVMVAAHHGHLTKNNSLPGLMAAQFPQMWGSTEYRYVHCGHRHHIDEKEHPGIVVVQHPTLAARDAYAARGGWHAMRGARCETYHEEFGQVGRTYVTPEMVL